MFFKNLQYYDNNDNDRMTVNGSINKIYNSQLNQSSSINPGRMPFKKTFENKKYRKEKHFKILSS